MLHLSYFFKSLILLIFMSLSAFATNPLENDPANPSKKRTFDEAFSKPDSLKDDPVNPSKKRTFDEVFSDESNIDTSASNLSLNSISSQIIFDRITVYLLFSDLSNFELTCKDIARNVRKAPHYLALVTPENDFGLNDNRDPKDKFLTFLNMRKFFTGIFNDHFYTLKAYNFPLRTVRGFNESLFPLPYYSSEPLTKKLENKLIGIKEQKFWNLIYKPCSAEIYFEKLAEILLWKGVPNSYYDSNLYKILEYCLGLPMKDSKIKLVADLVDPFTIHQISNAKISNTTKLRASFVLIKEVYKDKLSKERGSACLNSILNLLKAPDIYYPLVSRVKFYLLEKGLVSPENWEELATNPLTLPGIRTKAQVRLAQKLFEENKTPEFLAVFNKFLENPSFLLTIKDDEKLKIAQMCSSLNQYNMALAYLDKKYFSEAFYQGNIIDEILTLASKLEPTDSEVFDPIKDHLNELIGINYHPKKSLAQFYLGQIAFFEKRNMDAYHIFHNLIKGHSTEADFRKASLPALIHTCHQGNFFKDLNSDDLFQENVFNYPELSQDINSMSRIYHEAPSFFKDDPEMINWINSKLIDLYLSQKICNTRHNLKYIESFFTSVFKQVSSEKKGMMLYYLGVGYSKASLSNSLNIISGIVISQTQAAQKAKKLFETVISLDQAPSDLKELAQSQLLNLGNL